MTRWLISDQSTLALETDPETAKRMNELPKVVFSRNLKKLRGKIAAWDQMMWATKYWC